MSKILVTGSAGFIGSHLVEALTKLGHDVYGVDNMRGGSEDNIINKDKHFNADTADLKTMQYIIKDVQPEIVYHLACTAHEGLSVFSPYVITHNTFDNTMAILSASVQGGVKRFIYASSMSRYGKLPTPFTEDMQPEPEDPYAISKVAAEQVIKQMSETHGIEYVIAIPHNVIGTRQCYTDPYRNVVSIFINRNLKGQPAIIYGDGEQQRSFSYIDDCMYSFIKMMDCESGGVYNIGPDETDGEVHTVNQLADIVAETTGYVGEAVHVADRPREVKIAHASSEKIRKEFGYETKTSLREAVDKMVEDIKNKGVKDFNYDVYDLEIVTDKTPRTWTDRLI